MDRIRFTWELLSRAAPEGAYPDSERPEMLGLVQGSPSRALELGCHRGAMGAALKRRHPGLNYTGIEINAEAAAVARTRIDEVIEQDFLTLDREHHPAFAQPFDLIVLADVLEHLYDPWRTLLELGAHLAPGGRVLASVPNARNYWLISELIKGNWTYSPASLLDITHIRFFTLRECQRMFAETGYRVDAVVATRDPRVNLEGSFKAPVTVMTQWFALHDVDQQTATELSALQFLFTLSRP